ncbi:MAG: glycosyltransferase family A protein [Mobilicoccus sp.]|nr:glycosyltransferase family A protein [Mobilicoccus sp.]
MTSRRYVVVSPCRDEEDLVGITLAAVAAQTERPTAWVIVDDGSTDDTPRIVAEFAARHDWVTVITRPQRQARVLGSGVVEAFEAGLATIDLSEVDYLVKLDVDLDLPPTYFARLMDLMEADDRLASVSGIACTRVDGHLEPERGSFEMTVGMSKFYRVEAFEDIGGFARMLMWDGIDCHTARSRGWKARAVDEPELRFEHLRPMGSSDRGILRGKRRHGRGQYLMGTHPAFLLASVAARLGDEPRVLGALNVLAGYTRAALTREERHPDRAMRSQMRRFQLETLALGKERAVHRWEDRAADLREQGAVRPVGDQAPVRSAFSRDPGRSPAQRPGRRSRRTLSDRSGR